MTTGVMQVNEVSLINFDRARQALAKAHSIDEVKQIRDQAEAIRAYIKKQKGSLIMQNQAAEIKIRAERRAGEMLRETELSKGAMGLGINQYSKEVQLHNVTAPTLEDLGISRIQSHRWQAMAEVPEEKVNDFINETAEKAEEITSRAILSMAMKIKHEQKKAETTSAIIPAGEYQVIVVDPPWEYKTEYDPYGAFGRIASPYKEMSIEEIMMMDIPAANDCLLWLWTTNKFMHEAYHILEAWAFEPKTILTWYKQRTGVGYWLRGDTEHCILSVKGQPVITHIAQSSFLSAKAGTHSEKPDEFYALIDSLCPGKKLDMFARKQRIGWEVYGNQL